MSGGAQGHLERYPNPSTTTVDYYLKNTNVMLKKNNLSEYDWIVLADQYRKFQTKNIGKNKDLNL